MIVITAVRIQETEFRIQNFKPGSESDFQQ